MAKLQFSRITKDVENIEFDCGINSINGYIQQSYYPFIIQQAYTYSVKSDDLILGFYQVLFRDIYLEDLPDDIEYIDSEINNDKIIAVHIRFIAVDSNYHRKKIGTSILRSALKRIKDLSKEWPIRIITIDARKELVDWYKREGFLMMKNNTVGQDGVSDAMYFSLINYPEEIEEYEEV